MTNLQIHFVRLLRQIQHMGRKKRFAVGLEIFLVGFEHAIKPREEFLRAVIGMQNDRDTISFSDVPHEMRSGNGAEHGRLLFVLVVGERFATNELGAA